LQAAELLHRHREVVGANEFGVEIVECRLRDLGAIEGKVVGRARRIRAPPKQAQIVLVALEGARPRPQQCVGRLLRVLPLEEAHVLHKRLQRYFVRLAQ
jgi:hypothetical protein